MRINEKQLLSLTKNLGIIEGLSYAVPNGVSDALMDAVEEMSCILEELDEDEDEDDRVDEIDIDEDDEEIESCCYNCYNYLNASHICSSCRDYNNWKYAGEF